MKARLWVILFFAGCAWADEAADRAAIVRVIAALNAVPRRGDLFTPDVDGRAALERPTVVISHEPWGEATINLPGTGVGRAIASRQIRFVTPDVAVVDGEFVADGTALFFVMKRDAGEWRIASVRLVART
jgi:hypothetical protein